MAVIDLNNIKEQIQTILETENIGSSTVRDLSSGLDSRVKQVLKINPSRIPVQPSFFPYVTIFIDDKQVELQTMARNQSQGKRRADISVKIVGFVTNNVVSDPTIDEADDDCESLMENIEEILRNYETLNGTCIWSYPTRITYHDRSLDEETNLRAGIMDYNVTVNY